MQKFRKIPKESDNGERRRFYEFGAFRVDPGRRLLLRGVEPVSLTPKAFEILLLLVESRGEVLVKEELMGTVWPDSVVEDGNLNRNISTLRKALGESPSDHRYIVTVPGHGYRFVAEVRETGDEPRSSRGGGPGRFEGLTDDASADKKAAIREPIRSLAVLPLQNLSGDPEQEYFADGMTEALVTDLAQIHALHVVSRTSIMQYKATRKSLPQIARELNVDGVVEGSVLRRGGRVRIMVQLIHARTDHHLWANTYEGDAGDVLDLQSAVARAVVREIRAALTPAERSRLTAVRIVNPEAHEAHLKGRYLWNQRTQESLRRSVALFEHAISIDPGYAPAYVGLAEAHAVAAVDEFAPPGEAVGKAKQAVQRAIGLDSQLREAHMTLGLLKFFFDWEFAVAEDEFRRALDLSPNYATAHHWYGLMLMYERRFTESLQELRRAQALDPVSPIIRAVVGLCQVYSGKHDQAIRQAESLLEIATNSPLAHDVLGLAYQQKGMYSQAIAQFQKYLDFSGRDVDAVMRLGCAYAVSGDLGNARALLDELRTDSPPRYVSPCATAALEAALGDNERALASLDDAFDQRASGLLVLAVDPVFDSLRSDARFCTLIRKIGLPVDIPGEKLRGLSTKS